MMKIDMFVKIRSVNLMSIKDLLGVLILPLFIFLMVLYPSLFGE